MLNWSSNAVKSWVVVGVGALVLALSAFFILSNFSPDSTFAHDPTDTDHQDAFHVEETPLVHIHYAENGMDPVQTFVSEDPEGAGIQWDIMGTDAADFTISGGVLSFKKSPNYERPTDVLHAEGMDPNADPVDIANNNRYVLSVQATEVRRGGYTGPAKSSSVRVVVFVTDMEEPGMVDIDLRQPEVGVQLTASATDPDGDDDQTVGATAVEMEITNPSFVWARSKVNNPDVNVDNHWTAIGAATNASYTPVDDDDGRSLRVMSTYDDRRGIGKMRHGVTEFPVRMPITGNGSPDIIDNGMRTIAETAMVGDDVGAAIDVSEPNAEDQGKLTFALVSAAGQTPSDPELSANDAALAEDINYFAIDKATGQITVDGKLDHEAGSPGAGTNGSAGEYIVRVTVRDPSGTPLKAIDVTITVTAVNEPPMISMTQGMSEISIAEATGEGAYTLLADSMDNRYMATDQELDAINWSLEGKDAGDFDIEGVTGEPNQRKLDFKVAPDYEMPADDNGDNVFKVTLVATDDNMTGKRDISITVTNQDETGKVTLMPEQPELGNPVTATLEDPDGGVTITSWAWWWADDDAAEDFSTISDTDTRGQIDDATTPRYTPVKDNDGKFLQAVVTYTDEFSAPGTGPNIVRMTTANAVRVDAAAKRSPRFASAATERRVAENTPTTGAVGAPVMATDEDQDDATLTYVLEGTDSNAFTLATYDETVDGDQVTRTTGQILVGDMTMLDYEKKNNYSVVVKATDSDNQSATTRVTIRVTNVDEAPMFMGEDADFAIGHEEDNTGVVTTFRAPDPENARLAWDLMGTDASRFTISSSGTLMFKESPDFEMPMDAAHTGDTDDSNDANNNQYVIFVRATEAGSSSGPAKSAMRRAVVTVTDKEEGGMVTMNLRQPEIGAAITASATDPDGDTGENPITDGMVDTSIDNPSWQWFKSNVNNPAITNENQWDELDGETNANYTPNETDDTVTGRWLRARATYRDRRDDDEDKVAYGVTEFTVRAALTNNGSPDITDDGMRTIAENATVGDPVGDAIEVGEPNMEDLGKLTFGMVSATDTTGTGTDQLTPNDDALNTDISYFAINKATGQITVDGKLDHEAGSPGDGSAGEYIVRVTVQDPSGAPLKSLDVTITVTDVNEPPAIAMAGDTEISVPEHTGDGAYTALTDVVGNSYSATDQELNAINWDLAGEDAADFEIRGHPVVSGNRRINFKTAPDYEMPADADGNNVYKVTLVATDGNMEGRRDIIITVTNVAEDGKVELSAEQPHLGVPLTATLTDSDGVLSVISWTWVRVDGTDETMLNTATTNMYTPVDTDEGKFLKVTAMYQDGGPTVLDANAPVTPMADKTSDNAVLAAPAENNAPMFPRSSETRMVSENAATGGIVGDPLMAMDADKGDMITYSLEGTDKDSFALTMYDHDNDDQTGEIATGQIIVGGMAMFDHETKTSYSVNVVAMDKAGQKATVRVTINVTDFNEAPKTPTELSGDLAVYGPTARNYEEGMTAAVATYQVAGATLGASVTWTLMGTDMDDFDLSSNGDLKFMSMPDYEMPMDADMDNVYEITIEADDGINMATHNVTITVTNRDDMGRVTFWRDGQDVTDEAIMVGDMLGGLAEDPDGNPGDMPPITGENGDMYPNISSSTWQWSKSMTPTMMDSWMPIDGAAMAAYEVMSDDAGYYLRATAMYTDGHDSGKSAMATTTGTVTGTVTVTPGDPLLAEYDPDGDGMIERADMRRAVTGFFATPPTLTRPEMRRLVGIYFQ